MNRSSIAVVCAGVLAATVVPLTGVASAAAPTDYASTSVSPAGPKKATVTWDPTTLTGPFDAYYVTLDNKADVLPFEANRSRFVAKTDPLTATFGDLNASTNYFATVYAIDYTDSGIEIVEPSDTPAVPADTPIGYSTAKGGTLTLNGTTGTILAGTSVNLSGTLTGVGGAAPAGSQVRIQRNPYPTGDDIWIDVDVSPGAGGAWNYSSVPSVNTIYRAVWVPPNDPDNGFVGAWTRNNSVDVRKKLKVNITPGLHINAGTALTFKGKLPAVAGFPTYYTDNNVPAQVERLVGGVWTPVGGASQRANATGNYTISFTPAANADGKYRVFSGLGSAYADSFTPPKRIVIN